MPGRTIAIGDIHGCSAALAALLAEIEPQPGDQLITLGDYIDRGPDSRGALDLLIELSRRCWLVPIMGNHDMLLLGLLDGKRYMLPNWMALGGQATLWSFDARAPEDIPAPYIAFLRGCCGYHESARHAFVHANYLPNVQWSGQPRYVLRWESLKVRCPPPHYSRKTAIVGHTAQKNGEILDLGHLRCIDTYCYGGGWLSAVDVGSGEVWQANLRGALRKKAERC